jgi:hypothetical protein
MTSWNKYLNSDPTEWLLEENNPSVKYFTLTDLLECPKNDINVKEARQNIMEEGPVPKILAKQKLGGYWETPANFYVNTKYKGTVWSLIILAELYADEKNEKIRKACEFVLKYSQDRLSGGFAYKGTEKNGGDHDRILPCLTGNMVWSLIRFGYLDDPRIQESIDWIVKYQRFDDAIERNPKGWPYEKRENCWGKHTCNMGIVKNLKALAEIPEKKRTEIIKQTIKTGAEFMLKHHIFKRSHDIKEVAKQEWLQFGFPLIWKIDSLEILDILTKLGYKDNRMQEAIDLVLSKQNSKGRWILEKSFNGRTQTNIERKSKESKWITLFALRVLKRYYS